MSLKNRLKKLETFTKPKGDIKNHGRILAIQLPHDDEYMEETFEYIKFLAKEYRISFEEAEKAVFEHELILVIEGKEEIFKKAYYDYKERIKRDDTKKQA